MRRNSGRLSSPVPLTVFQDGGKFIFRFRVMYSMEQYVASPKIASLGFQMERKQTSTLVTINGDVSSIRRAKREYRTGFSR